MVSIVPSAAGMTTNGRKTNTAARYSAGDASVTSPYARIKGEPRYAEAQELNAMHSARRAMNSEWIGSGLCIKNAISRVR